MKPLKPTLSIAELQKTIGLWKSRKITDSVIPKLLNLYLGLTPYMNEGKAYPVENFYEISIALAFKNAKFLTEAVKRCGSFGIMPEKNAYGMKLFYSPLWVGKISQEELPDKFPETYPVDDIYNNPLAELNKRIFKSANRFVVNVVYILKDCKCTYFP